MKKFLMEQFIQIRCTYLKLKVKQSRKIAKKIRGISNNKIGIGVATNKEKSIFIVAWTSKPSFTSTLRTWY